MSAVLTDLQYRVVQIQVFLGEGHVTGWRFLFRHWATHQEELYPDRAVADNHSTRQDVDLSDHEFLVDATFTAATVAIDEAQVNVITGVEFLTSARRVLRVGTGFAEPPASMGILEDTNTFTKEVRAISVTPWAHNAAIISDATPTYEELPTRSQLDAARLRVIHAASSKCHHETECTTLEETACSAQTALSDVLVRGVVVPVAAISAFLELALKSAAVLTSCGRSAVTWRGKRRPALLELTAAMDAIRDEAQTKVPCGELQALAVGDAVSNVTSESVFAMVRNAIATFQPAIAARLFVKYNEYTPSTNATLVHEVLQALLPMGEEVTDQSLACFGLVREVVDSFARVSGTPVASVMDPYRVNPPALCEWAVRSRDAALLHWLVVQALMDPLDVAPELVRQNECARDSQTLVALSTAILHQRRDRYDRLIGMIGANGAADDAQDDMAMLLTSFMEREEFQRGLLSIAMADRDVKTTDVLELVAKMTSVEDLACLAPVAACVLSSGELKRFFDEYCAVVIAKGLIQVDDDCEFFNAALRAAETHGYLDMYEAEKCRVEARAINNEAAPFIREFKLAVRLLHARFGCLKWQLHVLHQCLEELKEIAEVLRRRQLDRAVALMSSILYVVGSSVVRTSHDVFELGALTAQLGHDGWRAVSVDQTTVVDDTLVRDAFVDGEVQLVLAAANVDERDFVTQLRGAVQVINDALLAAMPSSPAKALPPDLLVSPKPSVPTSGRVRRVIIPSTVSPDERGGVDSYHAAVLVSGGDLDRFKQLETNLVANKADINARVTILVEKRKTRSNATTKTRTSTKSVPAHVYASHLGYRSIVDHLLANPSLRKRREFAFVTKWRARRVAKMEVQADVDAPAA